MPASDRNRPPTVALLLPVELETFARRPLVEELLRADGVVAVDPPRAGYRRQPRQTALGSVLLQRQAARLRKRLPGVLGGVVIFDPRQARLAVALAATDADCVLLYGPPADVDTAAETHRLALARATGTFTVDDADPLRDGVADVLLRERR